MYDYVCLGDSTVFQLSFNTSDSVLWNFGDIISGISNLSKSFSPKHLFTNSGTFAVTLTSYHGGIANTYTDTIFINPLPVVNLCNDTTICYYNNITLCVGNPGSFYLWSTGETNDTITCSASSDTIISYHVTVTNSSGCQNIDSIQVTFDDCVSIEDLKKSDNISIFPNPANREAYILKDDNINITEVNIYNQTGQKVICEKKTTKIISVSSLSKGVYIIEIVTNDFIKREKLMVR